MTSHWADANGGLRGSTFLAVGAAAYLLAAALHVGARWQAPDTVGLGDHLFLAALLTWNLTLFLVATGMLWTGIHPFMGRFGIGVGLFIYLQAAYLLFSLIMRAPQVVPPSALTVGRTFLLAAFALVEARNIGRGAALLLGLAAGGQFVRVLLRTLGTWPPLEQPAETILSALFMAATAVALLAVARSVRRQEEQWAQNHTQHQTSRFADFNNPQHDWNRQK